ncbi:hypothetical protein [Aquibium sp. ELW1220]|uniref:hypothetical protein n=1 Tax=Aquibium sp. ELW1220 TaxID=2976766 RepID=UPI00339D6F0E
MRSAPTAQASILAEIPSNGTDIELHSCVVTSGQGNRWCEVSWRGIRGWTSPLLGGGKHRRASVMRLPR